MDAFFYKLQQQVSFHQLDTDSEGDNDEGDDLTLSSQTQDIKDDEDQLAETPGGQAAGSKASFSSHRAADFPPSYRQVLYSRSVVPITVPLPCRGLEDPGGW